MKEILQDLTDAFAGLCEQQKTVSSPDLTTAKAHLEASINYLTAHMIKASTPAPANPQSATSNPQS